MKNFEDLCEDLCGTNDRGIKVYASRRLIELTAALEVMEQGRIADAKGILRNMLIRLAWDAGETEIICALQRQDKR